MVSATREVDVNHMDEQAVKQQVLPEDVEDLKELDRRKQRSILVKLVRRGLKDEEIGAAVGLSRWQVRNLRYKLGIKKDRSGKLAAAAHGSNDNGEAPEGLSLQFNGVLEGESAAARLAGLRTLLLAAGSQQFRMVVRLEEVDGESESAQPARAAAVESA